MNIKEIKNNIETLLNGVSLGENDSMLLIAELKEIEKFVKQKIDECNEYALNDLRKSLEGNEKTYSKYGYRFGISQSGTYSYKHFNMYVEKEKELNRICEKMKIAYKANQNYVDIETGEIYPPAEYKPSKMSIKVEKIK